MSSKVDWNPTKAQSNLLKHGVSFVEAQTVFGDEGALTVYDEEHSAKEDRYVTLGWSLAGNLLVVVHTDREDDEGNEIWWIISARRATRREARDYAKQTKNRG